MKPSPLPCIIGATLSFCALNSMALVSSFRCMFWKASPSRTNQSRLYWKLVLLSSPYLRWSCLNISRYLEAVSSPYCKPLLKMVKPLDHISSGSSAVNFHVCGSSLPFVLSLLSNSYHNFKTLKVIPFERMCGIKFSSPVLYIPMAVAWLLNCPGTFFSRLHLFIQNL